MNYQIRLIAILLWLSCASVNAQQYMNEIIFDRNAEDITKLIPRKTHTIHSTVKFTFPSDYFQFSPKPT
ncbi:MAG: hypothetical protein KA101_00010 [Saprospiraceae bacterium]|nr:hypothetical protein [Saprospiraceae bacterium]